MVKTWKISPNFGCVSIITGLRVKRSYPADMATFGVQKAAKPIMYYGPKAIAKEGRRAYTPCPHLPPLSIKVSQAEMEAGDCEGRLPPLFFSEVRCQISEVSNPRLVDLLFNQPTTNL
jgi:hypothetical protein